MILLASLLLFQGQRGAQRALVEAGADGAAYLARSLDEQVHRLLDPAEIALRLLSHDPMADAPDMDARLERLYVGFEILDANPLISAFYMGYPNGDFLLVRSIKTPEFRRDLQAPGISEYMVQTVHRNPAGESFGEWRFYDASHRLLEHRVQHDYRYDPRTRPWYVEAAQADDVILTQPYVFYTTRQVGITLARTSRTGRAVVGLDAALVDLGPEMGRLRLTPGTESGIVSPAGRVLAYPDMSRMLRFEGDDVRLAHIQEAGVESLLTLYLRAPPASTPVGFQTSDRHWYGMRLPLTAFPGSGTDILIAIPAEEMLAGARRIAWEQTGLAILIVLLVLPFGWYLGKRIGRPLRQLSDQLDSLASFDFSHPPGVRSRIREVRELGDALGGMSETIRRFLDISLSLGREPRLERLLGNVLEDLVGASRVKGGAVYLYREDADNFEQAAVQGAFQVDDLPMRRTFRLETEEQNGNDTELARAVSRHLNPGDGLYTQALRRRDGELQGFLVLASPRLGADARRRDPPFRRFVEELSGAVAVSIETRQMIEAQQRMLDAIIRLLADAIDAKSPYTSGHCERVPILATLLAKHVSTLADGPFADFQLNEQELEEFRMAAWLHDCGKITSPEHVVDKATKLETLYNRIHEIRTRFEVLLRDARIDYWRGVAEGLDEGELARRLVQRERQLQEDYGLLAQANLGGEELNEETLRELERMADQRWMRHFDNRIGISREEQSRLAGVHTAPLPVEERLLQDRPDHRVPWGQRRPPVTRDDPRNLWGFDMRLPEHRYNFGELHNLRVARGTLTDEERFHVNDHIVQTIIMLNRLPLPKHLRRVPEIAGNHHETLNGRGYPRRLEREDLSVPARIMAIADIFEALTAGDRPYKPAKSLSEALTLLAGMARDQHVDTDLFQVFVRDGIYRDFARQFLSPAQIDTIDEAHILALARGAA